MRSELSQHIRTNLDLVFERTLALSPEIKEEVAGLNEQSYPWTTSGYNPSTSDSFYNGMHKIFTSWDKGQWVNPLAEKIYPYCVEEFKKIDPEAKDFEIIRVILNCTSNDGKMTAASIHQDSPDLDYWSFLLYLKGTSGNTHFNQSLTDVRVAKTVEFRPFTLTIFPSSYTHQGLLPVDKESRFVLNYIVRVNTKLRDRVLDASSHLLRKLYVTD